MFITPSYPGIFTDSLDLPNSPINLELVTTIKKLGKPYGYENMFAIVFHTLGGSKFWVYLSEEKRNEAYDKIISQFREI